MRCVVLDGLDNGARLTVLLGQCFPFAAGHCAYLELGSSAQRYCSTRGRRIFLRKTCRDDEAKATKLLDETFPRPAFNELGACC